MGERLFQKLKPVCVDLVRSASLDTLSSLSSILNGADRESLQPLQQYVLLPLRIILKGEPQRPSDIIELAVDVIASVFKHTEVTSWEVFSDFFVILSLLISSGPDKARAEPSSEELKHSATKCLTSLLQASNEEVLLRLYSLQFLPPLGHAVSILLSVVEQEQLRTLRVDAMVCLSCLMCDSDASPRLVETARSKFCSFLPGISMSLCRVIQGDPKQGQNLTKVAIATWVQAVTWIMSDAIPPEKQEGSGSEVKAPPTTKDPSSLVVNRTADWLENTAKKLCILIGQICKQKTNSSWQVRLGLVHFATKLLVTCKRNLSGSNGVLLSLLVGLLADDWPDVAKASLEGLKEFKDRHMASDDNKLVEVLEENIYATMTALPRQMRSFDDDQKLATLNLVQGYLSLLGPKMNQMLRSSSHLQRFSMGLLQVLEFEVKETVLMEDASPIHQDLEMNMTPSGNLFKNFKNFSNEKILSAIHKICNLLGYYGDIMLLVDHFLDIYRHSDLHCKQACLVLNHILRGALIVQPTELLEQQESPDRETLETAVEMIIDEYLSEANWSLPTSVNGSGLKTSDKLVLPQKDVTSVMTLQRIQNNTLLTCLMLDGISTCALVLGPAFDQFLIRCLYPLLEKLAADKTVIRQTAFQTLHNTATSCGYSSIADLLSNNADYMVDEISHRLRHLVWNHHAPHVLRVTVEQCDAKMLPLLEDTIEEILWSLDNHYSLDISSFVALLQTVASAILKWFPPEISETNCSDQGNSAGAPSVLIAESNNEAERSKVTSMDDIQEFFLDHLRNKRLAEGHMEEEEEDMTQDEDGIQDNEEADFTPDKERDLPLHVKIIIKILERCKHHMATSDPRIRLKVLSTVQICVQALAKDTDQLLPAVHKVWPSLVPRFQDEEPLVVCTACDTLTTLSHSCGDFLRQRVAKDVLPRLISVLESSATTSRKAGPAYVHTAAHKLQLAALKLIGPLCQQLDIGENDLHHLSYVCLEYLSARQPVSLQEASRRTFSCFLELDADSLWLLLSEVCQSHQLTPASPEFPVVKFPTYGRAKEFEGNCRTLLQEIQGLRAFAATEILKSGEG
ncbi:TELO2-interacting protein 1 homolog isoform X2 [Apostichopus japonicus]|uniref:TELO2-interacting protein 1 homolog isoform X2 n=1 Tax=Stichopus japonicus TaxID=307972 RepID=UPI003AB18C28